MKILFANPYKLNVNSNEHKCDFWYLKDHRKSTVCCVFRYIFSIFSPKAENISFCCFSVSRLETLKGLSPCLSWQIDFKWKSLTGVCSKLFVLQLAGMESGYACFCGNEADLQDHVESSSMECNHVCFGDHTQPCGGDGWIIVFDGKCHWGIFLIPVLQFGGKIKFLGESLTKLYGENFAAISVSLKDSTQCLLDITWA